MASPITITTTPIVVANINKKRKMIQFQNTGKELIFIKKQNSNGILEVPSETNYDFILGSGAPGNSESITKANDNDNVKIFAGPILQIETTNSFSAITLDKESTLAVMETNLVSNTSNSCK